MNKVKILPDLVVNQIAAGEVVERPASVVKELLENALDAGATELTVILDNGGKSNIEVHDNGSGMSRDDALVAVERFGTSKINDVEDLLSIESFGFRGEALPSIASVSRFQLETAEKHSSNKQGVLIAINGGEQIAVEDKALPPGTRIQVKQLFFNVPARKNFMRSDRTEQNFVRTLVLDFAVSHPTKRFRFVSDGKEILNIPSTAIGTIFSRAVELGLVSAESIKIEGQLSGASGEYQVQGMLSRPQEVVSGANRLRLLVNGRIVRDKLMLRAVKDGYGAFIKGDKYPQGVLSLNLPPSDVDINVHPQKSEVRFRFPEMIFSLVRRAIERSLSSSSIPMQTDPWSETSSQISNYQYTSQTQLPFMAVYETTSNTQTTLKPLVPNAKYLGRVLDCYLIFEAQEVLYLVDMHAAHERVTFAELKRLSQLGGAVSQPLLIPEIIKLPAELSEHFLKHNEVLENLGFDCELIGDEAIAVRAVPSMMIRINPKLFFEELFSRDLWSDWSKLAEDGLDRVLTRMACHRSLRSGDDIKESEAYALLEQIQSTEFGLLCPHGRPVLRIMRREDLEILFGRRESQDTIKYK